MVRLNSCSFEWLLLVGIICWPACLQAQTTQGIISGRITDSRTGLSINGATVTCYRIYGESAPVVSAQVQSDRDGLYAAPLLDPGTYRITAKYTAAYQAQEVNELQLLVAGALKLDFSLSRLADLAGGQNDFLFTPHGDILLHYYAADVERLRSAEVRLVPAETKSLQTTLSYVFDPAAMEALPFAGRDIYSALVLLPGVTASTGTARGLGISVNGQRPSSSNFLLDGVENNNTLVTGPLTPISPESVQEYRVSTNSFSAEYGRTVGFIANAVTKSGGNGFHGLGYFYLQNEALNANSLQNKVSNFARNPAKQAQAGYQASGAVRAVPGLYWSSSFEQLRSHDSLNPQSYRFLTGIGLGTQGPVSGNLLARYPAIAVTPLTTDPTIGTVTLAQPVALDRSLAFEKFNYHAGPNEIVGRISFSRASQPDFIWSPYPGFTSGSIDTALSAMAGYQRSFSPSLINELRLSFGADRLAWDRAHSEVPLLTIPGSLIQLPGSPAFYSYMNSSRIWQAFDNLTINHGRNLMKVGGGIVYRHWNTFLTVGRDGTYGFSTATRFWQDSPSTLGADFARNTFNAPDYLRTYRQFSSNVFAEDTFRISSRLTLNFGIRYELFGTPRNIGRTLDTEVQVAPGMNVTQTNALSLSANSREFYPPDFHDWAPRAGIAFDLFGNGQTQLRAGYGIFYEQPFDNLWQKGAANSIQMLNIALFDSRANYVGVSPTAYLAQYGAVSNDPRRASSPNLTMFDPNFVSGRTQSYFYGVQQRLGQRWSIELNGAGALGRHLVTTDIINRVYSIPGNGRLNTAIFDDIEYEAPQGSSSFQAFTSVAQYRATHAQFQLSYTLSHSIDNQSDPLSYSFFNLSNSTQGSLSVPLPNSVAGFSKQFDSSYDRGNSNFDQRHNVVFFFIWDLPKPGRVRALRTLFQNWQLSQLAAFRTGFPFSVYATPTNQTFASGQIWNGRANLIDPEHAYLAEPTEVSGGLRLLNPAAFAVARGTQGTSGRNAFRGPGLYNIDFSVSRSFTLHQLGEAARITLRADAFNFLNHPNLGNPANFLLAPAFGSALYGRTDTPGAFPAATPLNETARQIQILLRLQW